MPRRYQKYQLFNTLMYVERDETGDKGCVGNINGATLVMGIKVFNFVMCLKILLTNCWETARSLI